MRAHKGSRLPRGCTGKLGPAQRGREGFPVESAPLAGLAGTPAAKAVTKAISRSKKGSGKRGKDDMDIHVHVGDVVMMGFDEAVDAAVNLRELG